MPLLVDGGAHLLPAAGEADATLGADARTWRAIAEDGRAAMRAPVGPARDPSQPPPRCRLPGRNERTRRSGAVRFRTVATRRARLSTLEAGSGTPVVAVHGLGGTKGSFLPTVVALADGFRVIAVDLPGFGDSDKPLAAAYDARYFAAVHRRPARRAPTSSARTSSATTSGGRVALEVGMRHPDRAGRLALWRPRWRGSASARWRRCCGWSGRSSASSSSRRARSSRRSCFDRSPPPTTAGPRRASTSSCAPSTPLRQVRLLRGRTSHLPRGAQPATTASGHGWGSSSADALFIWGRRDRLVPIAFARHVAEALPGARHLELDCGHVPQIERPRETHAAIRAFLRHERAVEPSRPNAKLTRPRNVPRVPRRAR